MSSERARRLRWAVTEADYLFHVALLVPDEKRFTITTSIVLAQKAFNVRRNPRVSLLFSDPTVSGLDNPPAVLVQGDAEPTDEIEALRCGLRGRVARGLPSAAGLPRVRQRPAHGLL